MSSINDRNDWKTVKNALQIIDIDDINTNVSHTKLLSHSVLCCLTIVLSVQHLFGIVASVLHLGNVQFVCDSKDHALLDNKAELRWVSNVRKEKKKKDEKSLIFFPKKDITYTAYYLPMQLLGVDTNSLQEGLTCRKIEAHNDQVHLINILLTMGFKFLPFFPTSLNQNCEFSSMCRSSAHSQLIMPSMPEMPWPKLSMGRLSPGWSTGLMTP